MQQSELVGKEWGTVHRRVIENAEALGRGGGGVDSQQSGPVLDREL